MKVRVDMVQANRFEVDGWWATHPQFVVKTIVQQLKAAASIWPELEQVEIKIPNTLLTVDDAK